MEERFKVSRKALLALRRLAEKRGDSLERTFEHCVSTETYMHTQLSAGKIILVQDPNEISICADCGYNDGAIYKVVFTYLNKNKEE